MNEIKIAESDDDLAACFDVLIELRPHLQRMSFVDTIRRLGMEAGLQVAMLTDGDVRSVACFRISEWLAAGRYIEIEDFVSRAADRSKGHGGALFEWISDYGRAAGCTQLRLVSNVSRINAHRFYERKGLVKQAFYFARDI